MSKVLHLAAAAESHEEVFMARYERLHGWALHLCGSDRALAEDLLQEAYVQFTLTKTDLRSIHNLDAYLFGLLRILHLSQLRRSRNRAQLLRTALDYDAAVLGLRTADPRAQLILREQLQRICRYACARKETSKAGSVLLLRFFLGYFPGEIARLCGCTRPAVEERLRTARAEAKAYLEGPEPSSEAGGGAAAVPAAQSGLSEPVDPFLRELRREIYQSRRGDCLTARQWARLYDGRGPLDCATLAHLASCPACLDAVNELLGLPLLGERHPIDTLGKDTRGRGKGGDDDWPGGAGAGRGGLDYETKRCRQRARETLEHEPQELCVAVNGSVVSTQRVNGPHSEQSVNVTEPIDFVEVLSEQDVRLLLLHVEEAPPHGPFGHESRLRLNDGRTLEASLTLNYPASSVRVVYRHPRWQAAWAGPAAEAEAAAGPHGPVRGDARGLVGRLLGGASAWLGRPLASYRLRPRPVGFVLVLSLLLVAALFFVRWRGETVSAAELLERSAAAERADAAAESSVTNRVFYLEQPGVAAGEPTLRRRVETWHSAARGLTVRRVYDEGGRLVIAEWVGADGSRTVLTGEGQPTVSGFDGRQSAGELLSAGALWRLNPSAEVFLDLVGRGAAASVEEGAETYSIGYRQGADAASRWGIVEAHLVIRKDGLRGVELRLVLSREGAVREYRLVERQFMRQPSDAAPRSVFDIASAPADDADAGAALAEGAAPDSSRTASDSTPHASASAAASAELEVEVNHLLHRVRADIGEQVTVRRAAGGRLRVEAVVETEGRKAEILRALGAVAGHPAVEVEVSTVEEAVGRRGGDAGAGPTSVLDVDIRDNAPEVDAELRGRFGPRLGDEGRAGEAILQLSERLIAHSRRAAQHAAALRRLAASFSVQDLDGAARAKLLAMIRAHAREYGRSVSALRQELLPLSPGGVGGAPQGAVTNDSELKRAAARLAQLSQSNDEAVRTAFTLSTRGQTLAPVKSPRFWAALGEADSLSRAISQTQWE